MKNALFDEKIICWFSGGVSSAVACKKAIEIYGSENCEVVFKDTRNEDDDTYRFKDECAVWYGKTIHTLFHEGYQSIQEVWRRFNSLNVATGAICSSTLKRDVGRRFTTQHRPRHEVFGFDINESHRARSMTLNNERSKPIYPLLMFGLSKKDCIRILNESGIDIPRAYKLGFSNNNCLKTGCVQGGIGYWQKMAVDFPEKFEAMAAMEHELTDKKQQPVTMLMDQSGKTKVPIFLKKHPDFPYLKSIDEKVGRPVEPMADCNGFCYLNDLNKSQSSGTLF